MNRKPKTCFFCNPSIDVYPLFSPLSHIPAGGGAVAPDGSDGSDGQGEIGGGGGGILGWLARQFVNQAKCIPLLRWPLAGFLTPRRGAAQVFGIQL
jgi:hypothetical protein